MQHGICNICIHLFVLYSEDDGRLCLVISEALSEALNEILRGNHGHHRTALRNSLHAEKCISPRRIIKSGQHTRQDSFQSSLPLHQNCSLCNLTAFLWEEKNDILNVDLTDVTCFRRKKKNVEFG